METYKPQGALRRVFERDFDELIISGPAYTGKTRACLELMHALAEEKPGFRGVIFRKEFETIENTSQATFEFFVLPPLHEVRFDRQLGAYVYPNGSIVALGSVDKPAPFMSCDLLFVQEVTELTKGEWREAKRFARQALADCNPDDPEHWVWAGRGDDHELLPSALQDNPRLYDEARGEFTGEGNKHVEVLERLTGARKMRLAYGIWCREGDVAQAATPAPVYKKLRLVCGRHPMDLRLLDEDGNGVLDGHIKSAHWSLKPPYDETTLVLELVDVGIDVELNVEVPEVLRDVVVARTTARGRDTNGHLYLSKEPVKTDA